MSRNEVEGRSKIRLLLQSPVLACALMAATTDAEVDKVVEARTAMMVQLRCTSSGVCMCVCVFMYVFLLPGSPSLQTTRSVSW